MSAASENCCGTCDPVVTEVPGSPGEAGTSGGNAYTETTGNFTVPATGNTETILVENSDWMVIGQVVYIEDAGYFEVISKAASTSFVGEYLAYPVNTQTGDLIALGAGVSPAGSGSTIVTFGVVDPEGAVASGPGAFYYNTAGASLWLKVSGVGNTNWQQLI